MVDHAAVRLLLVGLVLMASTFARPVHACSVGLLAKGRDAIQSPRDGDTSVPTNVALLVIHPGALVWTDPQGVEVAVGEEDLGPLQVIRPLSPLQPRTTYRLQGEGIGMSFTTGDGPDLTLPSTPRVFRHPDVPPAPVLISACGNPMTPPVCPHAEKLQVDAAPGVLLMDINQTNPDLPAGGNQRLANSDERFVYGGKGCEYSGSDRIRFSVVSVTGAWSGWNAAIPVDEPGGCACASPSPGAPWAGVVTLLWVLSRARRTARQLHT